MMRKEKRCRMSGPRAAILILAVAVLLFSLWMAVGRDLWAARKAERTEQDAKALYYSDAGFNPLSYLFPVSLAEEAIATPEPSEPPIHEDFLALYEANPHIVGWLKAAPNIDYPVVQSDNIFYLDHDYYGKKDVNGTLFLNEFNTLDPLDDVLLIHGHNMKSGAMFGDLSFYEGFDFTCHNPLITFRTVKDPEDVYYVPVFAFNASMDPNANGYFNIGQMSFLDDLPGTTPTPDSQTTRQSAAFQEYLDQLSEVSLWQAPTDVTVDDKLMMLVTCSYYHDDGRFMLVCRRLRADETPEEMVELYLTACTPS